MKRVVLLFLFSLITLILAEWVAAHEIMCRLKSWFQKTRVRPAQEKCSSDNSRLE